MQCRYALLTVFAQRSSCSALSLYIYTFHSFINLSSRYEFSALSKPVLCKPNLTSRRTHHPVPYASSVYPGQCISIHRSKRYLRPCSSALRSVSGNSSKLLSHLSGSQSSVSQSHMGGVLARTDGTEMSSFQSRMPVISHFSSLFSMSMLRGSKSQCHRRFCPACPNAPNRSFHP